MRKKICIGVVLAGISAGALSGITSNLAHALPPVSVSVSEYDIYPHGTWALAPGADTGQYNFTTAQHFTGNGSLHIGVLEGQHEWLNDYAYGCVDTPATCNNTANMTALSTITDLSYAANRTSGTTYPTLNMEILSDGVTPGSYTTLVYLPNANEIVDGTWQEWDAFASDHGTWVSTHVVPGLFDVAQSTTHSWSEIVASIPNAKIALGIGPNVGTGGTFDGYADDVVVGVSGTGKHHDFETVQVAPSGTGIAEGNVGNSVVNVPVTLTGKANVAVSVRYTTYDVTAFHTSDFVGVTNGIVNFAPGQTTAFAPVTIHGDTTLENNESFNVKFFNPSNAMMLGGNQSVLVRVAIGNDDLPNVTMTRPVVSEGQSANVTIRLSHTYMFPLSIALSTFDGSALAPSDYTPLPLGAQTTFPAGVKGPTSYAVSVLKDSVSEPAEQFGLLAVGGASLAGTSIQIRSNIT